VNPPSHAPRSRSLPTSAYNPTATVAPGAFSLAIVAPFGSTVALVVGALLLFTASFADEFPPFSACANVSLIGGNFTAAPADPNTDPNNPLLGVVLSPPVVRSAGFAAALYAADANARAVETEALPTALRRIIVVVKVAEV
jgi:hypothetical protein